MIKIEHTEVVGWEHAIRGMRNAMNSWHLSDSKVCNCLYCGRMNHEDCPNKGSYCIGDYDLGLAKRLVNGGTDHSKFMRMIVVYADVVAPLYFFKEFDTYKVGTVANSCSTMHKIHSKEFTLNDFSCEHLSDDWQNKDMVASIDCGSTYCTPLSLLEEIINALNYYRQGFINTKDKNYWWQMIQLLPSSYNQKRTVMLNYAVLKNIYSSRKNHKLDEWHQFCEWIETLPYSELITEK